MPNRKKHKKHHKHHSQKFARRSSSVPVASPTPAPSPSASATPNPVASATPSGTPPTTLRPVGDATGIDLRSCDTSIKTQNTPWCTAFSFVAIMENLICDHVNLAEHHAWSFYQEYSGEEAAKLVPGHKITTRPEWPELQNDPQAGYLNFAKHSLSLMTYIDAEDDVAAAIKVLDSGKPVYMSLAVPADMASCYATIRASTKITSGGHQVEIAGYHKDASIGGGGYWIIKQQWGIECGDKGYQYMPFSVCDNNNAYCDYYAPGVIQ